MEVSNEWKDFELISLGNKEKKERWGKYILLRPDPQIIWGDKLLLDDVVAHYIRTSTGGGYWEKLHSLPDRWEVKYKDLTFNIKLMGFKHTGLFPEQAINWEFMMNKIKQSKRNISVLNLFAYTGGATLACLKAGASVCHVDSSKGMVDWAKENVNSSKLQDEKVRYIVDDVIKFVKREIRRGNKYDAIIMDPPSYGRGTNNEVWDIEKDLYYLVNLCKELLSEKPLFFIINSYTSGLSPVVLENILKKTINYEGKITCGELGLKDKEGTILPCGIYGRYSSDE